MAGYYIYLIASLPMLHFGAKPPFSFERFLYICRDLIPEDKLAVLETIYQSDIYDYKGEEPALKRWRAFETGLRNELVRIRASRRHVDPARYIRTDGEPETALGHVALNAYRAQSMIESEEVLDRSRWYALDEIALGRYFDMDVLITYAYKLMILEKWERIESADRSAVLETVLAKG